MPASSKVPLAAVKITLEDESKMILKGDQGEEDKPRVER